MNLPVCANKTKCKRQKVINWDRVHNKLKIKTQDHDVECACHECPSSTPSSIESDMEDMDY